MTEWIALLDADDLWKSQDELKGSTGFPGCGGHFLRRALYWRERLPGDRRTACERRAKSPPVSDTGLFPVNGRFNVYQVCPTALIDTRCVRRAGGSMSSLYNANVEFFARSQTLSLVVIEEPLVVSDCRNSHSTNVEDGRYLSSSIACSTP